MRIYPLHPLTSILIAIECSLLILHIPSGRGFGLLAACLAATLTVPSRTTGRLTVPFVRVLIIAALFTAAIHCVRFSPLTIDYEGSREGLTSFVTISVPVVCVLFLSRRITQDELYAFLIDLRFPPSVILVLFRTIWLIPRMLERTDEVLAALKLRSVPIDTPVRRLMAVAPAISTIMSSMLSEITDNALVITARGFLLPTKKTHMLPLHYTPRDAVVSVFTTVLVIGLW